MRAKWWVAALSLVALALWAGSERRVLFMVYFEWQSDGAPPPLKAAPDEGAQSTWFDDYFTVELLAPGIYAIGEPRYHQANYNYLVTGAERAVLFDAGPGVRDIRPVVDSLTRLPVTFVPSHFHYDHIGADLTFERIAVVNLPYLRARAPDNQLTLTSREHLGGAEGFAAPTWHVSEWLDVGAAIDLGDRSLEVLYTPGHTGDSISLWDAENAVLLSGDYLYPGYLYGFLPNSSMGDYLWSAERLLTLLPQHVAIYGAHRLKPPGAPRLSRDDVQALGDGLLGMRDGSIEGQGSYPQTFSLNERLQMLAEPRWLQDWEPSTLETQ